MLKFDGQYAIVTGAASGIGKGTAEEIAKHGAAGIIIADLRLESAEAAANEISKKYGCRAIAVKTDVSSNDDIENLFAVCEKEFGRLHILVNCAGICPVATIDELDAAMWDKAMEINVRGTYLCSRKAVMMMRDYNYGKIINVASISGRIGGIATAANYAASKGAIISLTMALAKQAAKYQINVNAVSPAFVATDMTKNFTHFDPKTVPLGRIGVPEDIAMVIGFLACEESRYITGCTLDVTGGVYMS